MALIVSALPKDVQQGIHGDLAAISTQVQTLHDALHVAQDKSADSQQIFEKLARVESAIDLLPVPEILGLPHQILKNVDDRWYQMAAQIEASRASLDKTLSEAINPQLASLAHALDLTKQAVENMKSFAPAKNEAASEVRVTLPPDMLKQLDGHWYQMAAQIEASRSSLVETIDTKIKEMEKKLSGERPDALSRTVTDYATQRQIEQQTQILSELVATLGVLDAHMQQIKSEMHTAVRH
jgi:recombinational DNA repair ATPase RecF